MLSKIIIIYIEEIILKNVMKQKELENFIRLLIIKKEIIKNR